MGWEISSLFTGVTCDIGHCLSQFQFFFLLFTGVTCDIAYLNSNFSFSSLLDQVTCDIAYLNSNFSLSSCSTVEVVAKAQGFKPENVLFLIHEVFECLIAESYSGVHYDYFIPCMECQSQVCLAGSPQPRGGS